MKCFRTLSIVSVMIFGGVLWSAAQQPQSAPNSASALSEFKDEFDGAALDAKNWEQYSLEGGGKIKVEDGKLVMSGAANSRFGVRTAREFQAERFLTSAKVAKLSAGISQASGTPTGNAILVVLFDNGGVNRLEWMLTTEGRLEAWLMRDGRSERLDGKNLGTKEKSVTLGIARRGEDYFFMLNGEVGLQKNIRNLPRAFRVMLYGFGASKPEWEMASVITPEGK